MQRWLEERALRMSYWLLSKVKGERHTYGFNERVDDAQKTISEIVTVYYGFKN